MSQKAWYYERQALYSTTLTSTCIRPVGVVDLLVFLVLGDGSYRYV